MMLLRVVEQKFGGFASMATTGRQQLELELTMVLVARSARFKPQESKLLSTLK